MSFYITEDVKKINFYDADFKKRASISAVMNFFSETAIKQSEELGASLDYLVENNIMWFLIKWNFNIKRLPELNEVVTIRTWPFNMVKFHAYRQFEMIDKNDDRIITADSLWLLIDSSRRRPIRIPDDIFDFYRVDKNNDSVLIIDDLVEPNTHHFENRFQVRISDLDSNNHVTHSKYGEWAIDTIPMDIFTNFNIKKLTILYEKETDYGNEIVSFSEKIEDGNRITFNHRIQTSGNEKLVLLKTVWEK